jgi:glycerol-3-phosphate acyltransferase PlsX
MRIAIDAMGGDHAPQAPVEGTIAAAREWPDTEFVLIGRPDRLDPLLGSDRPANVTVVAATETIEAGDEPVRAVRRKADASMVVAGRMVKEGKVDAMLTSGNTGALMAIGLLEIGRLKQIERPGLAAMLPTVDNVGVLALDLGANMDAKPEHLAQYALMGSMYREKVHGMRRPRVGLLNVGTEPGKGNELTKSAFELLERAPIHFVGNVEARDVLERACDVLVCDGFAGNILLKATEGTAGAFINMLKDELTRSLPNKLAAAMLKPGLRRIKHKMDYKENNGAPLLGVNGLLFKSHGSADAVATKHAIRQARMAVRNGLMAAVAGEFGGK